MASKRSAKKQSVKKEQKTFFNTFSFDKLIPAKYQTAAGTAFILLVLVIFMSPAFFDGKVFQSGDVLNQRAYENFNEQPGYKLWNPYIFTGMPLFGYAEWNDFIGNTIRHIRIGFSSLLANEYSGFSFYLIILAVSGFFLVRQLGGNKGASLFAGVSLIILLPLINYLFEGHVNKLSALSPFPLILLMTLRMKEKIILLDIVILTLAVKFLFQQWHVQIIFYTYFTMLVFYAYYIIRSLVVKHAEETRKLVKAGLILTVITAAGFAMHWHKLGQMYEYTPYSTRGTKSILDRGQDEKADKNFYEYSTNWSFSPGEVLTFFVPSYYGFGDSEYDGPIQQAKGQKLNTYFGQMPFTNAPQYMGIVILGLALYAFYMRRKEPFVQFLMIINGIALLLSFGRTFPLLFDIFFYYVPFFDKFRAPAMILVILQVTFPILAALGIMSLVNIKKDKNEQEIKVLKILGLVLAGLFILILLLNSAAGSWFKERVLTVAAGDQRMGNYYRTLADYMTEMFVSDLMVMGALLALTFLAAWAYVENKLNTTVLISALVILSIIDLWRVNSRALHYRDAEAIENRFTEPDYITYIKNQNDSEPYRLLNLKQDGSAGSLNQNSNFHVYFLEEDFYGYSALKPRSYQDIIDIATVANPTAWRMLNVKYIIGEKAINAPGLRPVYQGNSGVVHLNNNALPRAYFVDSVANSSALDFLNKMKANGFDPKRVAFVENDKSYSIDKPDSTASVSITNYERQKIEIDVTASGNNLLFVGNIYYPPGWKAYINGEETEIVNLNHGYTGIIVPKGNHKILLDYHPDTFYNGIMISLILNIGIVVLIGFVVFTGIKNRESEVESESE